MYTSAGFCKRVTRVPSRIMYYKKWRGENEVKKQTQKYHRKKIEFSFGGMKVFRKGNMQNYNRNSFSFFYCFPILLLKCLSFSLVAPGITSNNFSVIVR